MILFIYSRYKYTLKLVLFIYGTVSSPLKNGFIYGRVYSLDVLKHLHSQPKVWFDQKFSRYFVTQQESWKIQASLRFFFTNYNPLLKITINNFFDSDNKYIKLKRCNSE